MKGLQDLPTNAQLTGAYQRLQLPAPQTVSVKELALFSQWSRFDPRLGEILISYLDRNWFSLTPIELNSAVLKQAWPSAMGVLVDQMSPNFQPGLYELKSFLLWKKSVLLDLPVSTGFEQFFIGTRAFAGKLMFQDVQFSILPYLKWGYLGSELLKNKAENNLKKKTWMPYERRLQILEELKNSRPRFTVKNYIDATGGKVSRRQAELDLANFPGITARGNTRGRFYTRK